MTRLVVGLMTLAVGAVLAASADAQPPGGGKKGPPGKEKGPRKFELGKVLPPFAREAIELTTDQEKQIADLEKEVKAKLERILTADQKKALADFRPMGGPGGDGGPPGKKGKDKDKGPAAGPEQAKAGGGVQWFATWEAGKAEAARTGKPILFVSAAPHCAGVSGIW